MASDIPTTTITTGLEIQLLSADYNRESVFPHIGVQIQQISTASPSSSNPESPVTPFPTYTIPTVTVELPHGAQINGNGGFRRLLDDVKATFASRRQTFREWSMQGPDEARMYSILTENTKEAVKEMQAMRQDIEARTVGEVEDSEIWQRMTTWEINEMLIAIARIEVMKRDWVEST